MSREPAAAYLEGVRAGDRRMVAKTITLLESTRSDHAALGQAVDLMFHGVDSRGSQDTCLPHAATGHFTPTVRPIDKLT